MSKLKKLSVKSNVLTDSEKKAIRGAIGPTPIGGDCCCDACDERCGTKQGSQGGQWGALDS